MKTPMQELIDKLKEKQSRFKKDNVHVQTIKAVYENVIMLIESELLEKEKQVIIVAADWHVEENHIGYESGEQYFEETFEK